MKKLRRIIPWVLVVVMALSVFLVSCKKGDENENGGDEAVQKWSVTFDLNYQGAPAATVLEVENNQRVTKPADPTRSGYKFTGWYTDAACKTKEEFLSSGVTNSPIAAITSDTKFYAGWEKIDNTKPNNPDDNKPNNPEQPDPEKVITEIEVEVKDEKIVLGEYADESKDAFKVTATYDDDTQSVISDFTVEGFYTSTVGTRHVTVKSGDIEYKLDVKVFFENDGYYVLGVDGNWGTVQYKLTENEAAPGEYMYLGLVIAGDNDAIQVVYQKTVEGVSEITYCNTVRGADEGVEYEVVDNNIEIADGTYNIYFTEATNIWIGKVTGDEPQPEKTITGIKASYVGDPIRIGSIDKVSKADFEVIPVYNDGTQGEALAANDVEIKLSVLENVVKDYEIEVKYTGNEEPIVATVNVTVYFAQDGLFVTGIDKDWTTGRQLILNENATVEEDEENSEYWIQALAGKESIKIVYQDAEEGILVWYGCDKVRNVQNETFTSDDDNNIVLTFEEKYNIYFDDVKYPEKPIWIEVITQKQLTDITAELNKDKVLYVGGTLTADDFKVTAKYSDDSSVVLDSKDVVVKFDKGNDTTTVGTKTYTVSYSEDYTVNNETSTITKTLNKEITVLFGAEVKDGYYVLGIDGNWSVADKALIKNEKAGENKTEYMIQIVIADDEEDKGDEDAIQIVQQKEGEIIYINNVKEDSDANWEIVNNNIVLEDGTYVLYLDVTGDAVIYIDTVRDAALDSITLEAIEDAPIVKVGDTVDYTKLFTVTANYTEGKKSAEVTNYTVSVSSEEVVALATDSVKKDVTLYVSYTEGKITKTATTVINVYLPKDGVYILGMDGNWGITKYEMAVNEGQENFVEYWITNVKGADDNDAIQIYYQFTDEETGAITTGFIGNETGSTAGAVVGKDKDGNSKLANGTFTVYVNYGAKTFTVIVVEQDQPSELVVKNSNKAIVAGSKNVDQFVEGLEVTVKYTIGEDKVLTATEVKDLLPEDLDLATVGNKSFKISYSEKVSTGIGDAQTEIKVEATVNYTLTFEEDGYYVLGIKGNWTNGAKLEKNNEVEEGVVEYFIENLAIEQEKGKADAIKIVEQVTVTDKETEEVSYVFNYYGSVDKDVNIEGITYDNGGNIVLPKGSYDIYLKPQQTENNIWINEAVEPIIERLEVKYNGANIVASNDRVTIDKKDLVVTAIYAGTRKQPVVLKAEDYTVVAKAYNQIGVNKADVIEVSYTEGEKTVTGTASATVVLSKNGYFILGINNDWGTIQYELTENPDKAGEYMIADVAIADNKGVTGDEDAIKIAHQYVVDGNVVIDFIDNVDATAIKCYKQDKDGNIQFTVDGEFRFFVNGSTIFFQKKDIQSKLVITCLEADRTFEVGESEAVLKNLTVQTNYSYTEAEEGVLRTLTADEYEVLYGIGKQYIDTEVPGIKNITIQTKADGNVKNTVSAIVKFENDGWYLVGKGGTLVENEDANNEWKIENVSFNGNESFIIYHQYTEEGVVKFSSHNTVENESGFTTVTVSGEARIKPAEGAYNIYYKLNTNSIYLESVAASAVSITAEYIGNDIYPTKGADKYQIAKSDIKVTVNYDKDKEPEVLADTAAYSISKIDASSVGAKTVEVSYNGLKTTIVIGVYFENDGCYVLGINGDWATVNATNTMIENPSNATEVMLKGLVVDGVNDEIAIVRQTTTTETVDGVEVKTVDVSVWANYNTLKNDVNKNIYTRSGDNIVLPKGTHNLYWGTDGLYIGIEKDIAGVEYTGTAVRDISEVNWEYVGFIMNDGEKISVNYLMYSTNENDGFSFASSAANYLTTPGKKVMHVKIDGKLYTVNINLTEDLFASVWKDDMVIPMSYGAEEYEMKVSTYTYYVCGINQDWKLGTEMTRDGNTYSVVVEIDNSDIDAFKVVNKIGGYYGEVDSSIAGYIGKDNDGNIKLAAGENGKAQKYMITFNHANKTISAQVINEQ